VFDALAKDAARRRFDMVKAWSVDRLGLGLQDLVGFLADLHAYGIHLFLQEQGLDTTTPAASTDISGTRLLPTFAPGDGGGPWAITSISAGSRDEHRVMKAMANKAGLAMG
jgi:hypothetical protein